MTGPGTRIHAHTSHRTITCDKKSTLNDYLEEKALTKFPVNAPDTKNSITWHLWHIARIENMTMNILVANGQPMLY
ncbi:hypothetical protein Elgi_46800 [Paenibacillus elgii]|nr:hypothetical protein Elgi_46800 [Paenibacillus elgii]